MLRLGLGGPPTPEPQVAPCQDPWWVPFLPCSGLTATQGLGGEAPRTQHPLVWAPL